MDTRVISIGALARHTLWGERSEIRTGHATTTLITSGDRCILVDPGLPAQILVQRLHERARKSPEDITHVFLTTFNPETRRALQAFDGAEWLIHETEREAVGVLLATRVKQLAMEEDRTPEKDALLESLTADVAILRRCAAAPDEVAEGVALFPLPGVTPGTCGLLLEGSRATTLICGDALPTTEHLEQGQVLHSAADIEQARESFQEAVEVADLLILGRDNIVLNPTKRPF